jgi:hypothetical protein
MKDIEAGRGVFDRINKIYRIMGKDFDMKT